MSRTEAAQHTPGPWRVESRGGMEGREVRAGATYVVATVNTTGNDEGNRLANARLIAAAPELLAALQDMIAADNMEPRTWPALTSASVACADAFTAARAAIRKATEGA